MLLTIIFGALAWAHLVPAWAFFIALGIDAAGLLVVLIGALSR